MIALSLWLEEVEFGCQRGLTPDEAAREAARRLDSEQVVVGGRGKPGPIVLSSDGCPRCGDPRILPTGRCQGRNHFAGLDN